MPALPTDGFAAAQFLVDHMYRPVDGAAAQPYFAVTETEKPLAGDVWYWNDDNAKVLEFLSRPELWQKFPRETAEIFRFVTALCRGPFIFRRIGAPQLAQVESRGPFECFRHSLLGFRCDLPHGRIIASQRYHDARNYNDAGNVTFGANQVEFSYRRRRFSIAVDEAVTDTASELDGHSLTLRHAGDLYFNTGFKKIRLGRIVYTYTSDDRSMFIEAEAALDVDPNADVKDVILTIGHIHLNEYLYAVLSVHREAAAPLVFSASRRGPHAIEIGGAAYYQIRHRQIPGESLALHALPREPGRLAAFEAVGAGSGLLSVVRARYRFPGAQRGARLVAAEHKLLTAGGFYDRTAVYAPVLQEAVARRSGLSVALDLSTSYDYGATINAFAKCFAAATTGQVAAVPKDLPEEARSLFDAYLRFYLDLFVEGWRQGPITLGARDLAFVILGVVTMYRALGKNEYLRALTVLCDTLLEFELQYETMGERASGFLSRPVEPFRPSIDDHSAALLALSHAAPFVDTARLAAAIDRGLSSYCLETAAVEWGTFRKIDTLAAMIVDHQGNRRTEHSYWNYKAGLTLRLFRALCGSQDPILQAVAARHAERLEIFELVLRRQLEKSVTQHGNKIEILTGLYSAETNSETQPWVMLGLLGHPCD